MMVYEEESSPEKEMNAISEQSSGAGAPKQGVLFAKLSDIVKSSSGDILGWSRSRSLWPLNFELACCSLEPLEFGTVKLDAERAGYSPFKNSPRQSDVMIVAGWVTKTMVPEIKRMYEQMLKPKYVIAYGECALCGGPWWESYNIIQGIDQVLPVDVYVAGCPPRPENLYSAFVKLQKRIGGEIED